MSDPSRRNCSAPATRTSTPALRLALLLAASGTLALAGCDRNPPQPEVAPPPPVVTPAPDPVPSPMPAPDPVPAEPGIPPLPPASAASQ